MPVCRYQNMQKIYVGYNSGKKNCSSRQYFCSYIEEIGKKIAAQRGIPINEVPPIRLENIDVPCLKG